jgi:hypothetical protein
MTIKSPYLQEKKKRVEIANFGPKLLIMSQEYSRVPKTFGYVLF